MPKVPEATASRQHPTNDLQTLLMSFGENVQAHYRLIVRTFPGQHHEASLQQSIAAAVRDALNHAQHAQPNPEG